MDSKEFKRIFTELFEAKPKERSVKIYTNEMGYRLFDAQMRYEADPSPENKYYLDNLYEIVRKEKEVAHNTNMIEFIKIYGLEDYNFICAYLVRDKYWLSSGIHPNIVTELFTETVDYEYLYHEIIYRRGSFIYRTSSDYGQEQVKEICSKNRVVELLKQYEMK